MTHVTCRLTAKNRDQLRNPIRSAIECGLAIAIRRRHANWALGVKYAIPDDLDRLDVGINGLHKKRFSHC